MLEKSDVVRINRKFRAEDESHLWPIKGRFNATERAIKRVRKLVQYGLCIDSPSEYESVLDAEISAIVNDERNW